LEAAVAMTNKERKQWIANEVKEAVQDKFARHHDVTVIDISPLEISIRVIDRTSGGGPKYYRIKVSEAY